MGADRPAAMAIPAQCKGLPGPVLYKIGKQEEARIMRLVQGMYQIGT